MDKVKKTLPVLLANQAQNFFVASWKKQGWDDKTIQRWPKRKDNGPRSKGRAILVKSGKLRRAVGQSIRVKTFEKIQLVVALPYAAVHNEGYVGPRKAHKRSVIASGRTRKFIGLRRDGGNRKKPTTQFHRTTGEVNVKATTMRMPRRRFMGDSRTLRAEQKKLIDQQLAKLWQA